MMIEPHYPSSAPTNGEFKISQLSDRPRLYLVHNMLTPEECDRLIALAAPKAIPSEVILPEGGERQKASYRTSSGAHFVPYENALIMELDARIERLTGIPASHGEGLQVLHYQPGQEYSYHFDFFMPHTEGGRRYIEQVGQRVISVLTYLNDVEAGGETEFPQIGLRVVPKKGCALVIYNVLGDDTPDEMTLHAGLKVQAGEKWLASKWLHDRVYPMLDEQMNPIPFQLKATPRNSHLFLHGVPPDGLMKPNTYLH